MPRPTGKPHQPKPRRPRHPQPGPAKRAPLKRGPIAAPRKPPPAKRGPIAAPRKPPPAKRGPIAAPRKPPNPPPPMRGPIAAPRKPPPIPPPTMRGPIPRWANASFGSRVTNIRPTAAKSQNCFMDASLAHGTFEAVLLILRFLSVGRFPTLGRKNARVRAMAETPLLQRPPAEPPMLGRCPIYGRIASKPRSTHTRLEPADPSWRFGFGVNPRRAAWPRTTVRSASRRSWAKPRSICAASFHRNGSSDCSSAAFGSATRPSATRACASNWPRSCTITTNARARADAGQTGAARRRDLACAGLAGARSHAELSGARRRGVPRPAAQTWPTDRSESRPAPEPGRERDHPQAPGQDQAQEAAARRVVSLTSAHGAECRFHSAGVPIYCLAGSTSVAVGAGSIGRAAMTFVYIVRCNFTEPAKEQAWNAWYSGPKIEQMLAKPYFRTCQRFRIAQGTGRRYLALWTLQSPEAFNTAEYTSDWGFSEWAPYIVDWSRDLFDGRPAPETSFAVPIEGSLHAVTFDGMSEDEANAARASIADREPDMMWLPI